MLNKHYDPNIPITMSAHSLSIGQTDTKSVLILNVQANTKLNSTNFPAWMVQFTSLLIGYDLFGFVDGTKPSPATTHADYNYWVRQDKLILHAILSSVDASIITMLGNVKNSKQAWDVLHKMFASKTRARAMHLKERLTRSSKGSKSVSEYLQGIKMISDELAIINKPIDDDDLVIHALNGLGSEFKEVSAALRTRENAIAFDELHDLLVDHETFLQRDQESTIIPTAQMAYRGKPHYQKRGPVNNRSDSQGQPNRPICQYCDKTGHTAKVCYKLHGYPPKMNGYSHKNVAKPTAHSAMYTPHATESDWILDSGATHHLTNTLDDLHITNPYQGKDQITIGDGNTIPISHVGKANLSIPNHTLHLPKVFHVPNISCKLLSVSNLCKTNPISIEFFHDYYLIKDLKTKAPLLKGLHKAGLYYLPRPLRNHQALTTIKQQPWHHILGHPNNHIMKHLSSLHKIKQCINNPCISCSISKSHKLPFTSSTIKSTRPLEIIYSDVWGPAPIRSLDGYLYYLIFVDHYSKYIWLYPMKFKSDVSLLFPQFQKLVEKYFNLPIVALYSDNGGEYIKLKSFLSSNGISHYTTPPHTPELNSTAERRHRHLAETARALLHHANLPSQFWSFAFTMAAYLINRLPTPNLNMQSPYFTLHKQHHNIRRLHSFGCLCFPWLKPYTHHKLQPKSIPCIFIGYSPSQYAYQCLDPKTNKIYTSRHVVFHDNQFPYPTLTQIAPAVNPPTTNRHNLILYSL